MTPTEFILQAMATLLADDTATLANASAMNLHIAKAPFTPGLGLDLAAMTEADFGGYASIPLGTGNQLVYTDVVSGLLTIEIKPGTGGLHFQATSITNLPQTVYGWYITDNGNTQLYGAQLFANPITLTAIGDGFDVPSNKFAVSPNSLS